MQDSFDVIVVGGGVMGLCAARELAKRKLSVAIVERGIPGREASWAGAGILPPFNPKWVRAPHDVLKAESAESFKRLAAELMAEVAIDIELLPCGAIELISSDEPQTRAVALQKYETEGTSHTALTNDNAKSKEPGLQIGGLESYFLPDVCQVRNPRLLRALIASCNKLGVFLFENCEVVQFESRATSIHLRTNRADHSELSSRKALFTTGAWTGILLKSAGVDLPIFPVRGQIAALQAMPWTLRHVIHFGKKYLVPRKDGIVLVGSTEEDVGFDKTTTPEAIDSLLGFARQLVPELANVQLVASWAGLRPACSLDRPIVAALPDQPNVWVAAGHFREGLQLAPITADLLADWLTGREGRVPQGSFPIAEAG